MATIYGSGGAVWQIGGAEAALPAPRGGAVWQIGGDMAVAPRGGAVWQIGGEFVLADSPEPVEEGQYILMGPAEIFNPGLTETLLQIGLGGRGVKWGFLQECRDADECGVQVIMGEDLHAAAVLFELPRTDVSLTAIFLRGVTIPKRGDLVTWLNMDGQPISARVLRRERRMTVQGAAVVAINATKWDGMP